MTLAVLAARAESLGLPLDSCQLATFERYRDELLAWNQRVNLTSITDPAEVERRHFVDALTCWPPLDAVLGGGLSPQLIDVGSGAGLPGLPLKLAQPKISLTLLDSVGKKTAFLKVVVERLGLTGVEVLTARAEDLARLPVHRQRYDAAVARALAPLAVLLELCLPFVRIGGRLVAPRRGDLPAQQAAAEAATSLLGGRFLAPLTVELGPGLNGYGLVVVEKVRLTPDEYPRRAGLPAKKPLG